MRRIFSIELIKQTKVLLLSIGLVMSFVVLLATSVNAVSVSITHNPTATDSSVSNSPFLSTVSGSGGNTVADGSLNAGYGEHVINVWDINVPSGCLAYVSSVQASANYTSTDYSNNTIGAGLFVGDGAAWQPWGTSSLISGDPSTLVPNAVTIQEYEFGGTPISGASVIGGTWSSLSAPTILQLFVLADATFNTGTGNIAVSEPTVQVNYSTGSPSLCTNTTPTVVSSFSSTTSSAVASGSTVVSGSSLGAADLDLDTLSYSITSGNTSGYFAIDPSTGNITTTQANIPAGTYILTVQVDDGNGGTATSTVTITVTNASTLAQTGGNSYQTLVLATIFSVIGFMILMNPKIREND